MIVGSKTKDGTYNVVLSGKVSRSPKIFETQKGDKVSFSIAYGKDQFMNCDAWADNAVGKYAARLEKGDCVLVSGVLRTWDKNGERQEAVGIDFLDVMGGVVVSASAPKKDEGKTGESFEELPAEDEADLPF